MIYLGIDPGAKGAVGYVEPVVVLSGEPLDHELPYRVFDLPRGRSDLFRLVCGLRMGDFELLSNTTDDVAQEGLPIFAALERPGYGPPMGKSAAVKLRESFERCACMLVAAGIPFEEVSPQEWKKVLFKGTEIKKGKEGKAQARARAMELFPSLADQLSRVKDDGRAEALLLAEYARRLRAQ